MSSAIRTPFQNVTEANKQETQKLDKPEKFEKQELVFDKTKLDQSLEHLDKIQLLSQIKQYTQILKQCFEENDILRERIQVVEAQFSELKDQIEERETVIMELHEKLTELTNK